MFKRPFSTLSLLSLLGISSLAMANPLYSGNITTADHGFYVSAEGGYAYLGGTPNKYMNGSTGTHQVGGLGWGANLGYSLPLDAVAALSLEAGYADNGRNKYTGGSGVNDTGTLKITSTDYQMLGGFNTVTDSGWNFFVKAGAAYVNQKANLSNSVNINGTTVSAFNNTHRTVQPMGVLGVGYKLTQALNAYVEASYIYGQYHQKWSSVTLSPGGINASSAVFAAKLGLSYAFQE